MLLRIVTVAGLAGLAAACATQPSLNKTVMPLGEVDMTGMECRRERPINTNQPRTVCASPQQWAAYDKKQQEESDRFFENQVKRAGTDVFRGRRD